MSINSISMGTTKNSDLTESFINVPSRRTSRNRQIGPRSASVISVVHVSRSRTRSTQINKSSQQTFNSGSTQRQSSENDQPNSIQVMSTMLIIN